MNCRMILTSTSEARLEKVKADCLKISQNRLKPDDILVLPYNIADFAKNDEAFKKILDKFGNIDILVNNAARMYMSKVRDDDFELHRELFNVNYFANIYLAKLGKNFLLRNDRETTENHGFKFKNLFFLLSVSTLAGHKVRRNHLPDQFSWFIL